MKAITFRALPWMYIVVFALAITAIVIVGSLYYREQKEAITQEKKKELETIIDLKVQEIVNWKNERTIDALTIYQNRLAANAVQKWFEHPAARRDEQDILGWLESKVQQNQYKRAYLFDGRGTRRLTAGASAGELGAHVQRDVKEALKIKHIIFGDFEKDDRNFRAHLDVFIPLILIHDGDTVSVAVVLLQIDPQEFFFPSPQLNTVSKQSKRSTSCSSGGGFHSFY